MGKCTEDREGEETAREGASTYRPESYDAVISHTTRVSVYANLQTCAKKHFHSVPLLALMQSWLTPPLQFCILNTEAKVTNIHMKCAQTRRVYRA